MARCTSIARFADLDPAILPWAGPGSIWYWSARVGAFKDEDGLTKHLLSLGVLRDPRRADDQTRKEAARGQRMQLGMVGLGRMGSHLVRRLLSGDHECVVFDVNSGRVDELQAEGGSPPPPSNSSWRGSTNPGRSG